MERRTKITVHPPDSRGLREVRIGAETVGSAWSPQELRRILCRNGYPKDLDLEDRSSVCWQGAGSDTWPDHTRRRRATIVLMVAGLVGGWALLTSIGIPDAFEALTFAGRITGFVFMLGGVAEVVAAVAVFDYWGKRGLRVSGAIVLIGILIALTVTTTLVFLWFQETEYTPYMLAVFPLFGWSLWAVSVAVRAKVWRGTPQPTKIAAGVMATVLLAAVNIAYSSLYQPTAAPANLALKVRFGVPRMDLERPVVHLPVTLHLKNTGSVPVYILGDDWSVYGRTGEYVEKSTELRDRRKALESGDGDVSLHVGSIEWTALGVGPFVGPGYWFEPGEEYSEDKVVQIPKSAKFDVIDADMSALVMRMDRGRIDLDTFGAAQYSWDENSILYCPPKDCQGEFLIHHAPVRYNNNVVNVTRKPRYVTAWWGLGTAGSNWDATISTFKGKGLINDAETQREYRRYDLFTVEAYASTPFAAVMNPSRP
ncbi:MULTISPECIES: hypothetical protein [unclassified Streptomyces]|uniref:hypothetical protein n=1 Tax=unclassified Streptomyces TaxID=2593676 RepID=UPI001E542FFE|nr:hypothetical protein [Streptomyces sp. CB02980]MCB8907616.1 hypothetical protein [Streptomyces sp. CB02980]